MKPARLAVLAGVLILAGCSAAPQALPAEDYYELARTIGVFAESSDSALDGYADEACGVLRSGEADTSWLLGVKYLTDAGMSGEDAGRFLVYAASYRCPEMIDRFPEA